MNADPLGVTVVGDEVEDDIMGDQRYITLPDGRLRFHHVNPMPIVPMGPLPLRPSDEEQLQRAARGYVIEPALRPIALGPIVNRMIDGEAWADKMNEALQKVSDVIPKVPFFMNVFGTINAGKTSTLVTLLNMLTVPGGFTQVTIGSKSLGSDPMLATWLRSRNPGVKVFLKRRVTEEDLMEQGRKVETYYHPYFASAVKGRLRKVGEHDAEDDMTRMRPYDSILHPHTDAFGVHHHERPHIPDYSHRRVKDSPWLRSNLRGTMEPVTEESLVFNSRPPVMVQSGDIITGSNLCLEELVYNAVNSSANYQEASEQMRTKSASKTRKNLYTSHQEPEPMLYIMEDAARSYDNMRDAEWIRQVSAIRHRHASAIMLQQKFTTCPLFCRTIETDGIIFATACKQELDALEKSYGDVVPDFKGKLYAATQEIPGGPDRGFMYVKKREFDKVYRCFEGRIVSA